jgi:multidrug resistance efflux pump
MGTVSFSLCVEAILEVVLLIALFLFTERGYLHPQTPQAQFAADHRMLRALVMGLVSYQA